jgi:hypothetical protein
LGIPVNNPFRDGNESPSLSLFYHLGIAKLWEGSFFWAARPTPFPSRGIGNGHMVTIKQSNPVGIQSITYEQRHLSTKDICRTIDQFSGAFLRSWAHNNSQNQAVF